MKKETFKSLQVMASFFAPVHKVLKKISFFDGN